jgi:hypothetical protein
MACDQQGKEKIPASQAFYAPKTARMGWKNMPILIGKSLLLPDKFRRFDTSLRIQG